jgi:hypothetical protein
MKTTIYYHTEKSETSLMKNLAAILGYKKFTALWRAEAINFEQGNFTKPVAIVTR